MAGRKRKPDSQKVVQGTFQKCRSNPDTPTPADDLPLAPTSLTDAERTHFVTLCKRIADMGVASSTDTEALTMAAKRLAEIDACDLQIATNGAVVDTTNTRGERMLRGNPAVRMRSEAMRHLQSLLAEFGLTPAARSKVSAKKKAPKTSAFTKRAQ